MEHKVPNGFQVQVPKPSSFPENVWLLIVDHYNIYGNFQQTDIREVYASHSLADQAFRRYVTGFSRRAGKKCTYDFITETKALIWFEGKVIAAVQNSRRLLRTKLSTRNRRCA